MSCLRQRLFKGPTSFHSSSLPFLNPSISPLTSSCSAHSIQLSVLLQCRFKSTRARKDKRFSPTTKPPLPPPGQQKPKPQPPPRLPQAPVFPISSTSTSNTTTTTPLTPIRPRPQDPNHDQLYEKLTGLGEIIADLQNWRRSRLLLTVLINGTAFVIFYLWVHEAHKSAKAKSLHQDDPEIDPKEGKLVTGTVEDERFLTPGQEWLLDNFTVTPINIREGRYWTLVTSIFSHQLPTHTFLNMLASHFLLTGLTPLFGTLPVATIFLAGGIGANVVVDLWMTKRGKDNFITKYPGQFFGGLGMSAANLSLLGFAASLRPTWVIRIWGVIPIKISWVIIGAWVVEAIQYWNQEGWEKIQSAPDGHMMGILVGLVMGVGFRTMYRGKLPIVK